MSKFERFISSASPQDKRRFIRARRKFAAHWVKQAVIWCEPQQVSRARSIAKARGITFGEYIIRQVEHGQPVPLGCA